MRWAAIDFETATRSRTSACSIGIVIVEDGEEIARESRLIRPPQNRYEPQNIQIHGITPEQTEGAPDFAAVWSDVREMIEDRPLVAHNAPFDVGVVRRCCEEAGIKLVNSRVFCTLQFARATYPALGSWRLPSVAAHVGIELDHHDALSDAIACSRIARACSRERGATGLVNLATLIGVRERWVDESSPRRVKTRG